MQEPRLQTHRKLIKIVVMAGGVAQVVERLLSKHEVLSSNSCTDKNCQNKKKLKKIVEKYM
jgi:hypothetical protein